MVEYWSAGRTFHVQRIYSLQPPVTPALHYAMTTGAPDSVRIFADDWLRPLPFPALYPAQQPLEVDLGCGKGRFLLARAAAHPKSNFLGMDRMLRRVRKVDRKVVRSHLTNVRLLRMDAYYAVVYLVPPETVSTYYIFFPDPWPKARHHKNRLFNPLFLDALVRTLVPGGKVHVATDHQPYFEEIEDLLRNDERFLLTAPFVPSEEEQTDFEMYYAGKKAIHRCSVARKP